MIQRVVAAALRMPVVVFALAVLLIAVGLAAYRALDIEAYPNPVPPMVEVITQPQGWSAEETERYVTIPLEIGFSGIPGLEHIRSQSLFGLSDVKCYFGWSTEYKDARQEVINRIQFVPLPSGTQATLSPWNAIGELFRYRVVGKGYSLKDLKTAEDWLLERQFKQVPGVIDVTSYGGESKEYHLEVDPYRLRAHGVTLDSVISAVQSSNQNVGGQRLFVGEQSYDVRGIGLLGSRAPRVSAQRDIEEIVLAQQKGTPVRVKDIADVDIGSAPRLGIVGFDDQPDVVQGIVLMRYGGETPSTLEGIHAKVDAIRQNHVLPPGMDIEPYYDRGTLVAVTTHTVIENLLVGMALVTAVLLVFLGHGRAALITAINIPLALLIAFCGLVGTHTSANLISLGAVDFGIVVDSTVIMMENIFHHLGVHGKGTKLERILHGAREVATPMTFSTLIIGVAFLPLFTMTGVSGVIFGPMARTYAFAIGGAICLALTLTPVLAAKLIPLQAQETPSRAMHALSRLYDPMFEFVVKHARLTAPLALVPILASVLLFPLLGREFMPKLEEGNFWIRATLPMSISLDQSAKYVGRMRSILRGCPTAPGAPCDLQHRKHPEIDTVVSQLGRPDDGTDVSGFYNIELFAPLKPFDEWRPGVTKEGLTDELNRELGDAFPGVTFNFSQMISDNVEEAVSGVKGENSVKVFGNELESNEKVAQAIVDAMSQVPGVKDLGMFQSMGQPGIRISPQREVCARYGLNTGDVNAVVQAAIGGQAIVQVYEGEKNFDLTVRWKPEYRLSLEAIREIAVSTPDGAQVPLGQLADIQIVDGPAIVYREDAVRYAPVKFSVRGRDLASTIAAAQLRVDVEVPRCDKVAPGSTQTCRPYDTRIEWGGEINELHEAEGRLALIVPLTMLLITFLTYSAVKTWGDTILVLMNIPVACTGGVVALLLARVNFSVSAAMGFISIFGIAVQDAILVVTYFQRLRDDHGLSVEHAAVEAAKKRLRPCLMTTLVAMIGLLPAAISNGIGSQTQKPLAIVVIGGAVMLAVVARMVQPPLLVAVHKWLSPRGPARPAGPPLAS
ncbi:MAG TPA: CusA/CzcA family heavy metal efflux RND transporter [Polyangiaceae bacterium]|nr:CusA/CzcA family heavy metal efflux RND transporter [Polyangiaceae bacterium]